MCSKRAIKVETAEAPVPSTDSDSAAFHKVMEKLAYSFNNHSGSRGEILLGLNELVAKTEMCEEHQSSH